jgi:hypothetical protein
MFTYKFLGLESVDAPTPYYFGSLPAKPELGHILVFDETRNRYVVVGIDGEGLLGEGDAEQRELAWTDIGAGKSVPTLRLQKLHVKELKPQGRSFDYEEVKEYSQENRKTRLSASAA